MNNNGNDKYLRRGENLAARMLGGEMMIMSAADSTLFSLNETAAVIWQAADGVTPLSEIVECEIVTRFEVDRRTAYQDALQFVEHLARHGIIQIKDEPIAKEGHEFPDGGNEYQGDRAGHPARRASRPDLAMQRALRPLLPGPRRPGRDDLR